MSDLLILYLGNAVLAAVFTIGAGAVLAVHPNRPSLRPWVLGFALFAAGQTLMVAVPLTGSATIVPYANALRTAGLLAFYASMLAFVGKKPLSRGWMLLVVGGLAIVLLPLTGLAEYGRAWRITLTMAVWVVCFALPAWEAIRIVHPIRLPAYFLFAGFALGAAGSGLYLAGATLLPQATMAGAYPTPYFVALNVAWQFGFGLILLGKAMAVSAYGACPRRANLAVVPLP